MTRANDLAMKFNENTANYVNKGRAGFKFPRMHGITVVILRKRSREFSQILLDFSKKLVLLCKVQTVFW